MAQTEGFGGGSARQMVARDGVLPFAPSPSSVIAHHLVDKLVGIEDAGFPLHVMD